MSFYFDYVFVSWTLLVEGGSSQMVGMMGGGCGKRFGRILHLSKNFKLLADNFG